MPYDLTSFSITPIPGDKAITIKSDYLIDGRFCDPQTGDVAVDFTGEKAVLISTLLETLPSEVLEVFVRQNAALMVAMLKGLTHG